MKRRQFLKLIGGVAGGLLSPLGLGEHKLKIHPWIVEMVQTGYPCGTRVTYSDGNVVWHASESWFKLELMDGKLSDDPVVKAWLEECETYMNAGMLNGPCPTLPIREADRAAFRRGYENCPDIFWGKPIKI